MSAPNRVRALLGAARLSSGAGLRKGFRTTCRRGAEIRGARPAPGAPASAAAPAPSAWSGRGVFAIAAAAGAIGWAVASLSTSKDGRVLFDSNEEPRYATMFEMNRVSLDVHSSNRLEGRSL